MESTWKTRPRTAAAAGRAYVTTNTQSCPATATRYHHRWAKYKLTCGQQESTCTRRSVTLKRPPPRVRCKKPGGRRACRHRRRQQQQTPSGGGQNTVDPNTRPPLSPAPARPELYLPKLRIKRAAYTASSSDLTFTHKYAPSTLPRRSTTSSTSSCLPAYTHRGDAVKLSTFLCFPGFWLQGQPAERTRQNTKC